MNEGLHHLLAHGLGRLCMLTRRQALILLVLVCSCGPVLSQDTAEPPGTPSSSNASAKPRKQHIPDHCKELKLKKTIDNFYLCGSQIKDDMVWRGIRPTFGGVVPGSGIGEGIEYGVSKDQDADSAVTQTNFKVGASVTTRQYWQAYALFKLQRRKNQFRERPVELNLYGQVKDMPRLDFFGTGPNSQESGLAKYHYREQVVGGDVSTNATSWLDVGAAVEGIWPRLTRITDLNVRAIEQVYNDQAAPGLLASPNYLRLTGYLGLHSDTESESSLLSANLFYSLYHDWGQNQFSFRRFDADVNHRRTLGARSEIRFRGRFSFSDTSPGQRVPFYLQETLGGSNLRSEDTLRGFRDYRFRDSAFGLFQTDFITKLRGAVRLILFYDTGKVAPSFRRFEEGRLRHSYGAGLVYLPRRLDKIVFRFYVAFGSGEGTHITVGPGDSIMGGTDRVVR